MRTSRLVDLESFAYPMSRNKMRFQDDAQVKRPGWVIPAKRYHRMIVSW